MTQTKTIERTTRTINKIVPLVFKKKTIPITLMIKHKRRLILWTMVKPKTEKNGNIELWSEEMYKAMLQDREAAIHEKWDFIQCRKMVKEEKVFKSQLSISIVGVMVNITVTPATKEIGAKFLQFEENKGRTQEERDSISQWIWRRQECWSQVEKDLDKSNLTKKFNLLLDWLGDTIKKWNENSETATMKKCSWRKNQRGNIDKNEIAAHIRNIREHIQYSEKMKKLKEELRLKIKREKKEKENQS